MATTSITLEERLKRQKSEADLRKQQQIAAGGGAPVTPLGVSGLGATPDQAKMAGVRGKVSDYAAIAPSDTEPKTTLEIAAEQAAQVTDVAQDQTLQTRLGERTFEDTAQTAAQQKASEFSSKMQQFGALGGRVEALVAESFKAPEEAAAIGGVFDISEIPDSELALGVTQEQVQTVLVEFQRLGATDPEAAFSYLADNQALFSNPNASLITIVKTAFKSDPTAMHAAVAQLVADDIIDPDKITLDHLMSSGFLDLESDLGLTEADLIELLGEDWLALTPEQIGTELAGVQADVLARGDQIKKALQDPNIPSYMRASLMNELRKMGAMGALQYEQEAAEAVQEARDMTTVMIGGQVVDVTDALQDESIKKQVVNYLSDPTSPENAQWSEMNPEFATWLDTELKSFGRDKDTLEANLDTFQDVQQSNEDFIQDNLSGNTAGSVSLDSWVMEAFGFGEGFQVSEFSAADSAMYSMLTDIKSPEVAANVVQLLNELPNSQRKYLKEIDPESLKKIISSPDKITEFTQMLQLKDNWAAVDKTDSKSMLDTVFAGNQAPGFTGYDDIQEQLTELRMKASFGGSPEINDRLSQLEAMFDIDGDGKIDDAASLLSRLQPMVEAGDDMDELVASGLTGGISEFRDLGAPTGTFDETLYNRVKKYVDVTDRHFSSADIDGMLGDMTDVDVNAIVKFSDDMKQAGFTVEDSYLNTQLDEYAEARATKAGVFGLYDLANFNSEAAWLNNSEPYRTILGQLVTLAEDPNVHPLERAAASAKVSEYWAQATLPRAFNNNEELSNAYKTVRGYPMLETPPEEFIDLFIKGADGWVLRDVGANDPEVKALLERWSNWSHFTENPSDMYAFLMATSGAHINADRPVVPYTPDVDMSDVAIRPMTDVEAFTTLSSPTESVLGLPPNVAPPIIDGATMYETALAAEKKAAKEALAPKVLGLGEIAPDIASGFDWVSGPNLEGAELQALQDKEQRTRDIMAQVAAEKAATDALAATPAELAAQVKIETQKSNLDKRLMAVAELKSGNINQKQFDYIMEKYPFDWRS